ncbi:MAG: hypothetical protein R2706_13045 [Acidimicrobiales bacterium]
MGQARRVWPPLLANPGGPDLCQRGQILDRLQNQPFVANYERTGDTA